jgi:hypothetical protein
MLGQPSDGLPQRFSALARRPQAIFTFADGHGSNRVSRQKSVEQTEPSYPLVGVAERFSRRGYIVVGSL